ncbi:LRR receptor-like kinase [Medicago truncatula]|uniref:LRR receptor-like kinase n=2 Tax=Medicago truncatula TaxID=3880 RepID=A0A072UWK0_MEDTR|nr:LRR receptor-like kinase [Medicago truncatula]
MNLCILELEFLSYLDLSLNEFDVIRFPSIQHNITHSSNLFYLDLSPFRYHDHGPLHMDNLGWLSPHSSLKYLDLSGIHLHKETNWLQIVNTLPSLLELQLSHCNLNNFPSVEYLNLSLLVTLDLSLNNFTSHLPDGFFNLTKDLTYLDLSQSNIYGEIPSSLLNLQNLRDLYLSYNQLQESVPKEIGQLAHIQQLDLSENQLQGSIPSTLGNLSSLNYLSIGSNNFSGEISNLHFSKLSSKSFRLDLSYNSFSGSIPHSWKNLEYLFYINLWSNRLSGSMTECIYNLTHMVTSNFVDEWNNAPIELFTKGQDYVYEIEPDRRTIDFSANNLSGKVPLELFRLVKVQTLNLSHNNFIGTIPKTIGGMKNMESLDFSNNKLCGEIPRSMSLLTFLGYLNLSYNNFDGKIPIATQLQSFNASSYIGNPKLCGAPLNNCTTEEENPGNTENEDDESIRESLYLGMGVGFAVGFWGICGSLFLIRKWRHAYFRLVDRVGDFLYVTLTVKLNSFRRN